MTEQNFSSFNILQLLLTTISKGSEFVQTKVIWVLAEKTQNWAKPGCTIYSVPLQQLDHLATLVLEKNVHAWHLESPRTVHHQSLESWRVSASIYLKSHVKRDNLYREGHIIHVFAVFLVCYLQVPERYSGNVSWQQILAVWREKVRWESISSFLLFHL